MGRFTDQFWFRVGPVQELIVSTAASKSFFDHADGPLEEHGFGILHEDDSLEKVDLGSKDANGIVLQVVFNLKL